MEQKLISELGQRADFVVRECDGIMPGYEAFYIQSIIYSAQAAADAFEYFESAVINRANAATIVFLVQEALTHSAALSRFFWPSPQSSASIKKLSLARASRLRRAFIIDKSPLEDRNLRNALEHFDERLDEFLLNDPLAGTFFPAPLVQPHHLNDDPICHAFRSVDPEAMIFVVFGTKYDFKDIVEDVQRILALAKMYDRDGRLP